MRGNTGTTARASTITVAAADSSGASQAGRPAGGAAASTMVTRRCAGAA